MNFTNVYVIAEITVTDDSWILDYAANVHNIVAEHGGKYLSRSGNITTVEGDDVGSTLIAPIEFPSMEAVQNFAGSEAYAPYAKAHQTGSVTVYGLSTTPILQALFPICPKHNAVSSKGR